MGYHQHGHALLGQRLHDGQHLAHHFGVQGRGGFVEEQHFGVHGQSPGNSHPLLLAAGDLPGLGIDIGGHANLGQVGHGGLSGLSLAALQHLDLADHAVFQHGHIVEQVEGLEHHAHVAAVFRLVHTPAHNVLPVVEDFSRGGGFQQVDAAKQGALAGAGSADDGGDVTLFHGEVNILQHLVGAETLGQVVDLQNQIVHISVLLCFFRV